MSVAIVSTVAKYNQRMKGSFSFLSAGDHSVISISLNAAFVLSDCINN